jgi:hypothetical protein
MAARDCRPTNEIPSISASSRLCVKTIRSFRPKRNLESRPAAPSHPARKPPAHSLPQIPSRPDCSAGSPGFSGGSASTTPPPAPREAACPRPTNGKHGHVPTTASRPQGRATAAARTPRSGAAIGCEDSDVRRIPEAAGRIPNHRSTCRHGIPRPPGSRHPPPSRPPAGNHSPPNPDAPHPSPPTPSYPPRCGSRVLPRHGPRPKPWKTTGLPAHCGRPGNRNHKPPREGPPPGSTPPPCGPRPHRHGEHGHLPPTQCQPNPPDRPAQSPAPASTDGR